VKEKDAGGKVVPGDGMGTGGPDGPGASGAPGTDGPGDAISVPMGNMLTMLRVLDQLGDCTAAWLGGEVGWGKLASAIDAFDAVAEGALRSMRDLDIGLRDQVAEAIVAQLDREGEITEALEEMSGGQGADGATDPEDLIAAAGALAGDEGCATDAGPVIRRDEPRPRPRATSAIVPPMQGPAGLPPIRIMKALWNEAPSLVTTFEPAICVRRVGHDLEVTLSVCLRGPHGKVHRASVTIAASPEDGGRVLAPDAPPPIIRLGPGTHVLGTPLSMADTIAHIVLCDVPEPPPWHEPAGEGAAP
jgi:hypothetical protein